MDSEILEKYEQRLHDHLKWYEHKSILAKKKFLYLRTLQTVILSILPVMFLFPSYFDGHEYIFSLIGGTLSIVALVITSFMQLSNFDSQWQQYRMVAEQLRREQVSFEMQIGEYARLDEPERIKSYIERVESLIRSENSKWFVGEKWGAEK